MRQCLRVPALRINPLVACDHTSRMHDPGQRCPQEFYRFRIAQYVPAADIGVNEGGCHANSATGCYQRLLQVAQNQSIGGRNAIRMGRQPTIEGKYLTPGKKSPQMVKSAPVAEAKFEDRTRDIHDEPRGEPKTFPLGHKPANEAIQSTHVCGC